MSYEVILAFAILGALILYALSGGADYGGGMWDLLASGPRALRQRDAIAEAIAPIWEANHVWLILLGWGLAQYPYLVVPDVTFAGAATAVSTMRMVTWALAVGALVLFPSFGYLFYVFKGPGASSRHEATS